jgi:uncharacterized protein YcnI
MSARFAALLVGMGFAVTPAALAHVSIATSLGSTGAANATQEIILGVGHGCGGDDTYMVRVEIPAGVTGVRSTTSDFGKATVEKNGAGDVTAIVWQKADADLLPADTGFYKLVLRAKLPNTPFTTIHFLTHQTCKSATGVITVTDWVGTVVQPPDAGVVIEPAPALLVVPARKPGWNKFTVPVAIADLATSGFFADALIVWRGTEAFSANAETAKQIDTTSGVGKLTSVQAGQEIWVKY